jgi:predicted MFS family arabinose efflux permease
MALLLISAQTGAPRWTVFAVAILAGTTIGSLGALVRARWSHLLAGHERGPALLHTAYSLESVMDEVVFISGPLLVTLLATRFSPTLGLLTAMAAAGIGGVLLLVQRRTEPRPSGRPARTGGGVLRARGMLVILAVMVCLGTIFGSVDVLVVAFADEQDALRAAGPVLASFAFGSFLAGLIYGGVQWRSGPGIRFVRAVLLIAAGISPLLLVRHLLVLAVVVFVAGFAISPILISGNALVREIMDADRLTEGLTWIASAIGVGVSTGAALAGAVVDGAGVRPGFAVPVGAGLVGALVVLVAGRRLTPAR